MLLNIRQVSKETTLSRATLYRLLKANLFPVPVRVSAGRVAWRREDIASFIATREFAK